MNYHPANSRYDKMQYHQVGRSGLKLPGLALGLWHSFGDDGTWEHQRAILRRAFDAGITHFDLANNYGFPWGTAEARFGEILRTDFGGLRDELIISSKAGHPMWPGPYGDGGSRKQLVSSLDQSLSRLGIDYVDIFYSHRPDAETPVEETMGALASAVHHGKALYVGISNYSPEQTRLAHAELTRLGVPLTIHQPRYSLLDRTAEFNGLFETLGELGVGSAVFSPLAQGMLTDRYMNGIPENSRAHQARFLKAEHFTSDYFERVNGLRGIAQSRGQTLSQMAIQWTLRKSEVTTSIIGASSVEQLEQNLPALEGQPFTQDELTAIDEFAVGATPLISR